MSRNRRPGAGIVMSITCAVAAGALAQDEPALLRRIVNPIDNQTYIWIPPGTFTMGCSQGDADCGDLEQPAHVQRIASGFWMGRTEVGQSAFKHVMGHLPAQDRAHPPME